jgi:anaphase-promoting complex subunit 4
MLPALDRCALILSRLSGIVKYQGPNDALGFSSRQIGLVMDTVACLNLVAVRILTYVVDELDLFVAFSSWLRHEIDRLASDASSPSEDVPEKEATIDHSRVLRYIQTAMTTSRLSVFFQESTTEDSKNEWATAEQGLPIFELLDEQLRKHQEGLAHMTTLPKVELLCKHLDQQASAVFQRIADAEKRNVLFGQPIRLGGMKGDGSVAIILCPEVCVPQEDASKRFDANLLPKDATHCKIYIALVDSERSDIGKRR